MLGRALLGLAFAAFTVWIHYEVKFVRAPAAGGTVQQLGALKVGTPAPDFDSADLTGSEVSLARLRDEHTVLLEFWATWCPPCRMVMETLRGMRTDLERAGVEVLKVNEAEPAVAVRRFVEREGDEFRVVLDSDGVIAERYGVVSMPTMVLIDRGGIVRWIHVGHLPETQELREELGRLTRE